MTKEKKTVKVKGGFRSTLALLISIIALIVAVKIGRASCRERV